MKNTNNCDNCVSKCRFGREYKEEVCSEDPIFECKDHRSYDWDTMKEQLHHKEYCPCCGSPMNVYQICDNELFAHCDGDGLAIECTYEARINHMQHHKVHGDYTYINVYGRETYWEEAEGGYYMGRTVCVESFQVNNFETDEGMFNKVVEHYCDLDKCKSVCTNLYGNTEVYDGEYRVVIEGWMGLDAPVPYYC